MRSCVTTLVFSLLFLQVGFTSPVPSVPDKLVLYHPTQKGTKWVYTENDGKSEETYVITAVDEKDGCKVVSVGREERGKVVDIRVVSVSGKGVYDLNVGDVKYDPPLGRVQLPAKTGDVWKLKQDQPGLTIFRGVGKVTVGEKVKVPAGSFTTIRVDWEYQLDYSKYRKTIWYAPDVGMVKMIDDGANKEYVMKSFMLPKD